jgi:hypothetical protein
MATALYKDSAQHSYCRPITGQALASAHTHFCLLLAFLFLSWKSEKGTDPACSLVFCPVHPGLLSVYYTRSSVLGATRSGLALPWKDSWHFLPESPFWDAEMETCGLI